ncbi:hypothetical protein GEMRC1_005025 [Eukaryota sp. GEM-RC1]
MFSDLYLKLLYLKVTMKCSCYRTLPSFSLFERENDEKMVDLPKKSLQPLVMLSITILRCTRRAFLFPKGFSLHQCLDGYCPTTSNILNFLFIITKPSSGRTDLIRIEC